LARFEAASGRSFQLDVVGYQFGQAKGSYWDDDNWLVIEINVVEGVRQWRAREPALQTSELVALVEWCRETVAGATIDAFEAIEPNLSFTATSDGGMIALTGLFRLEFAFPDLDREDRIEGSAVEFILSAQDLRRFADELETEGAKFPIRSTLE
jgi:hypothetical protein